MLVIGKLLGFLSGEFLLTRPHRRANGGTIIFTRALMTSTILYGAAIIFSEVLDPASQMRFSVVALRTALKATLPWWAGIFAAVYAALYARFASQWTYLAGLYNQIKTAEARTAEFPASKARDVITSWQAGFIEDADELHLALKPMYAALIRVWSKDENVRKEFVEYAPGGKQRLDSLLRDVEWALNN